MVDPKDLKVCFVAGTLGRGGAERQLIYMLKALKSAGVKTRVLCLTKGEPLEEEIRAMGIQVTWVGASRWRPLRLYRIIQSLRRQPADILQSAHFYTNLYTAAARRVLGIRDIGAIRCDLISELRDNGLAGRWDLNAPGHLVANSALACQRAKTLGIAPNRIDFVPNVVDTEWLQAGRGSNGHKTMRILFAGRLTEQKRPDRFLRVVSRVAGESPGRRVTAVIAGEGPMKSRLTALASTLGLGPEQVEFLGEQNDVRALYQKTDLLMLTSDWEGTPNVLLEAMAYGIPVVATRVGGVRDIIGPDRGVVVDPEDEDELISSTLRLIDDPGLRKALGLRGREYVTRFHSLEALQTQLLGIYDRVLQDEF